MSDVVSEGRGCLQKYVLLANAISEDALVPPLLIKDSGEKGLQIKTTLEAYSNSDSTQRKLLQEILISGSNGNIFSN